MTANRKLIRYESTYYYTAAMNSNNFLAYLFRSRNMVLSSVSSLVFYSTTVLLSTIFCFSLKLHPGFLEVSDFMQCCRHYCSYDDKFDFIQFHYMRLLYLARKRISQERERKNLMG